MPLPPNPRKTKGIRELGPVDCTALRKTVLAIPEAVWAQENADKPNKFDALDRTNHIVFRFVRDLYDWRQFFDRPLWAEWRPLLEPVLTQATAAYGYSRGAFPRVMLARMAPGGIIKPHMDASPAARWPHKIHVPLETNSQVRFFIGPAPYHLAEGFAYEVNNMGYHSVTNEGPTNRIHLIFEYFDIDQPAEGEPASAR